MRPVLPKAMAPDLGNGKYRIGVQLASGTYVPSGVTTMGSVIRVVQTQADGTVDSDTTCTTDTADTTVATTTYCGSPPDLNAYDTITMTQVSAPTGLVADPNPIVIPACAGPYCFVSGDYFFSDKGLPPNAVDDTAQVLTGKSVDIPVLANDNLYGAPLSCPGVQVTSGPSHGKAEVVPAQQPCSSSSSAGSTTGAPGSTTPEIDYIPTPGYVGKDTFEYSVTTPNGTSSATVSVDVLAPPPTARNDSAATTAGHSVTVDVLANDDANGGGALRVASVGRPGHGSVRIVGTSVVYTPASGFAGTDTFTYVAATAYGTDAATVTVRVRPVVQYAADALSDTGADSGALLGLSGGLLLVGGAASAAGRRRRPRRAH